MSYDSESYWVFAQEEDTSAGGEEPDQFPAVDCRTGHTALLQVCGHLETRYKCAEHLLLRAKDLGAALPLAAHAHQLRIDRGEARPEHWSRSVSYYFVMTGKKPPFFRSSLYFAKSRQSDIPPCPPRSSAPVPVADLSLNACD